MSTIATILILLIAGLTIPVDSTGRKSVSGEKKPESVMQSIVLFNDWHYVVKETGDGNRMVYFSKIRDGEPVLNFPGYFSQNGRDNQALIIQDHTGHDVRFKQAGETNRILIIQSDTTGNESRARVEQRGSGNRATIIQNNEQ